MKKVPITIYSPSTVAGGDPREKQSEIAVYGPDNSVISPHPDPSFAETYSLLWCGGAQFTVPLPYEVLTRWFESWGSAALTLMEAILHADLTDEVREKVYERIGQPEVKQDTDVSAPELDGCFLVPDEEGEEEDVRDSE